uniref:Uncharacterized protein n=1 Tax=viral metagenome TaxID=1070528 RepID=A0A6C0DBH6_9ZZZZ
MTVFDDIIKQYKQKSSYRPTETNYRSSNDYAWNTINRLPSQLQNNGNTTTSGSVAYGVHQIMMYNSSNMQIINR